MQTTNPFFDDLARLATGAAGALSGLRQEAETAWRARIDRLIADMDLVPRAECDAVKAIAVKALEAVEALQARVDALERAASKADSPANDTHLS